MLKNLVDETNVINLTAFSISFSSVEQALQLLLLAMSVLYTICKIKDLQKRENEK
jgi:hypothetical protein